MEPLNRPVLGSASESSARGSLAGTQFGTTANNRLRVSEWRRRRKRKTLVVNRRLARSKSCAIASVSSNYCLPSAILMCALAAQFHSIPFRPYWGKKFKCLPKVRARLAYRRGCSGAHVFLPRTAQAAVREQPSVHTAAQAAGLPCARLQAGWRIVAHSRGWGTSGLQRSGS